MSKEDYNPEIHDHNIVLGDFVRIFYNDDEYNEWCAKPCRELGNNSPNWLIRQYRFEEVIAHMFNVLVLFDEFEVGNRKASIQHHLKNE